MSAHRTSYALPPGFTFAREYRPPSRIVRDRAADAFGAFDEDDLSILFDADQLDRVFDEELGLRPRRPYARRQATGAPGLPTRTGVGAVKPPALGRVLIDATPEVLARIDRLTKLAESSQKSAEKAIKVMAGLGIGFAALATLFIVLNSKKKVKLAA